MKKLSRFSLGFLFVLISNFSFAQSYIPLVDTNKVWNVVTDHNFGAKETHVVFFETDTLIGANMYKKINFSKIPVYFQIFTPIAIREDVSDKKVYALLSGFQEERIIYDFSLEEGDTFKSLLCQSEVEMIVDNIDQVSLFNGEQRKRFSFKNIPEVWIEGIGSNYGVVHKYINYCGTDVSSKLLCYEEGEDLVYRDQFIDTCFVSNVSTNQMINKESVSIYPNPSSNFINVVFESSKNENFVAFQIYDIGGKLVMQNENSLENINEINLNISNLTQGVYTIVINTNETNYYEKIIKL